MPAITPAMWLDGLIGGLTLASVTAALVLTPVLASGGDAGELALTAGYVIGDVVLLCFVGLAAGLSGWKPGRTWSLIGLSLSATAVVDSAYAYDAMTSDRAYRSALPVSTAFAELHRGAGQAVRPGRGRRVHRDDRRSLRALRHAGRARRPRRLTRGNEGAALSDPRRRARAR